MVFTQRLFSQMLDFHKFIKRKYFFTDSLIKTTTTLLSLNQKLEMCKGWRDDGRIGPAQQQPQFHPLLSDVLPVQKHSFIHHTGQG